MTEKTPVETKKPYKAPVLSEYGDIRQMTLRVGSGTTSDNPGRNDRSH
jgi:hypothetical protein